MRDALLEISVKKFIVGACVWEIGTSAQARPAPDVKCSYSPSQRGIVSGISGAASGAGKTALAIAQATGLTVVTHSSGAYILTGAGRYVVGTLGGAVMAPVVLGVGLVVGGAAVTVELLCAPANHPEYVTKVRDAAEEFLRRSKEYVGAAKGKVAGIQKDAAPIATKAMVVVKDFPDDVFEYAYRVGRVAGSR